MGRFDIEKFKYLSKSDFRVLTAVEMGMKNHEFVPAQLLCAVANCKGGKTFSILKELCRQRLLVYDKSAQGEGYRLTFTGYDVLSLNVLTKRDVICQFGSKIGVGKESDIFVGSDSGNQSYILKLHRLGRNSFRKVKEKRDYMGKRRHASWLYLSRISATKEFEFLKILYRNGFPVPKPIDNNRHCIVMELIDGIPLCQVNDISNAPALFNECINLIVQFAQYGLIHGDFNEYNLIYCDNYNNENVLESQTNDCHIVVIDFPQMVSTDHPNAEYYFNRDVKCIRDLFKRKFNFIAEEYPTLNDIIRTDNLDKEVFASGFNKEMDSELIDQLENMLDRSESDNSSIRDEPELSTLMSAVDDCEQSDVFSDASIVAIKSKEIKVIENLNSPPTERSAISSDNLDSCVGQCNLNQIYELLDAEEDTAPIMSLLPSEKKSVIASTFTQKEITNKIRHNLRTGVLNERHKKSLKLAAKAGDSYRSRTRKENKARIKETLNDDL